MKRLPALLLALALLFSTACAEAPDVTNYRQTLAYVQESQPTQLDLGVTKFTPEQLWKLKNALPQGAVMTFTMDYCKALIPQDAREVDLNGHSKGVTAKDLEYLIDLLPNLEKLVFTRHRDLANKAVIPLIEKYPEIEFVWHVRIKGRYAIDSDATAFSSQKRLSDKKPVLTSRDLEVLKYVPNLRALDLGHHDLTTLDFVKYLPELRILILADNNIRDLTPLAQLEHLEYLELFRNKASDLSPLAGLTNLLDLNLCFMPLAESDLTVLGGLTKLERFWCNMSRVPEEMQQKFIEAHPDTLVMFDGTRSTDDGWRDHPRYTQYRDMFENFAWRPFE